MNWHKTLRGSHNWRKEHHSPRCPAGDVTSCCRVLTSGIVILHPPAPPTGFLQPKQRDKLKKSHARPDEVLWSPVLHSDCDQRLRHQGDPPRSSHVRPPLRDFPHRPLRCTLAPWSYSRHRILSGLPSGRASFDTPRMNWIPRATPFSSRPTRSEL